MAHYALIDQDNTVIQVIVGANEGDDDRSGQEWEQFYEKKYNCKVRRTSYNTHGGRHYSYETGKWSKARQFRGNFASMGYRYDDALDAFIPPKPYESWILNEETYSWDAPIPHPDDDNPYIWNEAKQKWDLIEADQTA